MIIELYYLWCFASGAALGCALRGRPVHVAFPAVLALMAFNALVGHALP